MAKGISKELSEAILELEPTSQLEFFLIYFDWHNNRSEFFAIHSGSNGNGVDSEIYWQGIRYLPFNVKGSNWELKNDQTLPRPTLTISNKSMVVSSILRKYNNLNNVLVVRKRTFARFLDGINFPNGDNPYGAANINGGFPDEKYYISRKISENKIEVSFELVTPLELENIKIPNRKIHSLRCPWAYRGYGCRYAGPPVADQEDNVFLRTETTQKNKPTFSLFSENGFEDTSLNQEGIFSKEYSNNINFRPSINSAETLPDREKSFYFQTGGALKVADPSDELTHESGSQWLSKGFSAWVYPYSGSDYNPSGISVLADFGDRNGGFAVYIGGEGASNTGFSAAVRTAKDGVDPAITQKRFFNYNNKNIFNKWNHVVFTYDLDIYGMNIGSLYINGKKEASMNFPAGGSNSTDVNSWSPILKNAEQERRVEAVSTGTNGIGAAFGEYVLDNTAKNDSSINWPTSFRGYLNDIQYFNRLIEPSEVVMMFERKNKSLFSLDDLNNVGEFEKGKTYNKGDVVYVEAYKYKIYDKDKTSGFRGIRSYYVCTNNGTTTDPRNDSLNWKKDSCSKSINGCSLRFGDRALPFGGFPGTHKYPFSQKQNGY